MTCFGKTHFVCKITSLEAFGSKALVLVLLVFGSFPSYDHPS